MLRHIPNILTALRLFAAPFAAAWIIQGYDTRALIVFILAGLSDAADGYLAKRFNLTTRFGAWLDPAADKILMFACFLALTAIHQSPLWLTALIIFRDLAIVMGTLAALSFRLPLKIAALPAGKASTVAQIVYIALILVLLAFDIVAPMVVLIAAVITAGFTLTSGLAYGRLFIRALKASGTSD